MRKKVISLIVSSNEHQWWLRDVIEGLWEFSDKIVVVDGSPNGPSTDGTIDYLRMLDSDKVTFAVGRFTNLHEQKNVAMKIGLDHNPDYFLTCDADEILHPEDLKMLRTYIDVDNAPPVVMFKMYHTWKDFQRHQIGGPFSNPFIRLFKSVEGIHYDPPPAGDEPQDKEGRYLKINDYYVLKTKYLPEPLTLHTGHSKSIFNLFLKILRYASWESKTLLQALKVVSINGWMDEGNPEPLLPEKILKKFRDFDDPCKGCPKSRNLIWYCRCKCEVGKKFINEEYSYKDLTDNNLKETLEINGIPQKEI